MHHLLIPTATTLASPTLLHEHGSGLPADLLPSTLFFHGRMLQGTSHLCLRETTLVLRGGYLRKNEEEETQRESFIPRVAHSSQKNLP